MHIRREAVTVLLVDPAAVAVHRTHGIHGFRISGLDEIRVPAHPILLFLFGSIRLLEYLLLGLLAGVVRIGIVRGEAALTEGRHGV